MHDAVSCVIPGAKRPAQVEENCRASDAAPLTEVQMAAVRALYDARLRARIHGRW
ncbi:MAG: hypothetical protein MUC42_13065 [Bryobacter sp.]|nr:hypothetical protein [Bryobacter sp.]